jgi:hypothetical protein
MKSTTLFALPVFAIAVLILCATPYAQNSDQGNGASDKLGPYRLLTTISNDPLLNGFDISWVDSDHGRYYLANRGNNATPPVPNILVIDTELDQFVSEIPLTNAPNGVVAIHRTGNGEGEPGAGTLVVGTTPKAGETSKVFFIALPSGPVFATVDTGGHVGCVPACRADELAYDPADHLILVANDRDQDLFVTLISTEDTPHVVGKIFYNGTTAGNPVSTGGIEQPVWDKRTRRFYLAIPSTAAHPNGEVDEIDPNGMPAPGADFGQGRITGIFPTSPSCHTPPRNGPAGLALIPNQRLMTSCGDVLDIKTGGRIVTNVPGVTADEIWFNPGDERVYFGRNPAYVVDAETYQQIVNPSNPNGPPIPAGATHSIAADSENNHIFIPVTGQGVKVYTDDQDKGKGQNK